jgi:hypothetical protein
LRRPSCCRRLLLPCAAHAPIAAANKNPGTPPPPGRCLYPVQQQLGICRAKAVVFKFVAAIPGGSSPARGTAGGIHALFRLSPVLATHFLSGTIFLKGIIPAVPVLRGSLRPPPAPSPLEPPTPAPPA